MRRSALVAIAVAGLVAGILVAVVSGAPRAHQPTGLEWMVQAAVIIAALMLLVSRVTGKR